jgi:hypothetical protein
MCDKTSISLSFIGEQACGGGARQKAWWHDESHFFEALGNGVDSRITLWFKIMKGMRERDGAEITLNVNRTFAGCITMRHGYLHHHLQDRKVASLLSFELWRGGRTAI